LAEGSGRGLLPEVLDVKSPVSLKGAPTVSVVGPQETPPNKRIGRKRAALIFMFSSWVIECIGRMNDVSNCS
jgi:hypothetical protein